MKDLLLKSTGKKVDSELTAVAFAFDPNDEKREKDASIIAVGWDRRVIIWNDEKKEKCEEILTDKILPRHDNKKG